MTVVFTYGKHLADDKKEHAVIIRQGTNVVKLDREALIEIFGTLKEMKKFFGAIG